MEAHSDCMLKKAYYNYEILSHNYEVKNLNYNIQIIMT